MLSADSLHGANGEWRAANDAAREDRIDFYAPFAIRYSLFGYPVAWRKA
jgi:hypothetical protein